ncbi:MAG: GTP-binding protein [Dehalococcoidia bacterium]|nr:GTP-binding protein [Dehalococcoidia bacterium]
MKINVVMIGHVDHGKSTLIGRLLYDSDSLTEGRVEEIQQLAQEYKRRFEFAYFLDSFDDELKEERTIDTTSGIMFKGRNLYTVTDVPGHKEFIKNMLTGASHADVAVLVVASQEGIQEQTGRHTFLVNMLGIKHLFVFVNKMDAVDYREEIYEDIKKDVSQLLESFSYHDVVFIPGSAMLGDNIYKKSDKMPWYNGPALIEALDSVKINKEIKPLRFVVQDIYTVNSQKIIIGRVESGVLHRGDDIIFNPSGVEGKVTRITTYDGDFDEAQTGDCVGIISDCEPARGDVGGMTADPPLSSREFLGEAVLLDSTLKKGEMLELRCGTARVKCKIKEIKEKINSQTGEVIAKSPDTINEHEAATIIFATKPIVVEQFSNIPELGRFMLVRDKNIAAGIVLETKI